MILTHGANSISRGGNQNEVEIGGRWYPYVQIGNQIWLAENLDYQWDGLTVGESIYGGDKPRANYYNNDQSTYGESGNKYGLLYNRNAVDYLEGHKSTLIPGWHVPTKSEWYTLAATVGGESVAGTKLKSSTGWTSGNGDNEYGFSAFPAGAYISSFYYYISNRAYFRIPYTENLVYFSSDNGSMNSASHYESWEFSIRLVKDVT